MIRVGTSGGRLAIAALCLAALVLSGPVLSGPAAAQRGGASKFTPAVATAPAVRDALAWVDAHFADQVAEWIRLTQIPGPSRHEQRRALHVRTQLEALGLTIQSDSLGNTWTVIAGSGRGPRVVFAAHMDTVHPDGTDLTVRWQDSTLHVPGVFDNTASVANFLAMARAWRAAGVRTRGDIVLLFTVQEELGLLGMEYWLERNPADLLVAVDGELGPVRYGALGIYQSRMVFSGPGSHTNTSRGKPHPARAAARCILDIGDIPLPPADSAVTAVANVGMVRGGTVVNATPEEVSFTVDLRSVDPVLLERLDSVLVRTCGAAAGAERVAFRREVIQREAAGGTPEQLAPRLAHPLVQTALAVHRHLGLDTRALATGSTDANVGVRRGMPSISVGRSFGGDQHTLREWADVPSARLGTRQLILLAAALAELDGR